MLFKETFKITLHPDIMEGRMAGSERRAEVILSLSLFAVYLFHFLLIPLHTLQHLIGKYCTYLGKGF